MKLAMISAAAVAMLAVTGGVAGAADDGKAVYTKSCAGCHTALNPKLGDKKAWGPLIKKGADALTASVVKGKGAMPPKGGAASLSDADIKAAVQYMIGQAK
ncbi:MAG: c-type cytochrome [Betaproteobacteria bacterium]|nr:c-type cytochrome [Betaproteobacteria bacterium]